MCLSGPSGDNLRNAKPSAGQKDRISSPSTPVVPKLDLHGSAPGEEMDAIFKKAYEQNYPVTRDQLVDLVGKRVIKDIDEARDFILDKMKNHDYLTLFPNPIEAVYRMESKLASINGCVCNLHQPLPEDRMD